MRDWDPAAPESPPVSPSACVRPAGEAATTLLPIGIARPARRCFAFVGSIGYQARGALALSGSAVSASRIASWTFGSLAVCSSRGPSTPRSA